MGYQVFVSDSGEVFDYEMLQEEYDAILDSEGDITIAGLTYAPSEILRNVDPVAYRVGFSDFDSEFTQYIIPDDVEWEDIPDYLNV